MKAYLRGRLLPLPFPGSLVVLGRRPGTGVSIDELPFALQIPLLANVTRHRITDRDPRPASRVCSIEANAEQADMRGRSRTSRQEHLQTNAPVGKILRDQDELEFVGKEASLVNVLFSTIPEDLDLYGKPMARNVQMWTEDR